MGDVHQLGLDGVLKGAAGIVLPDGAAHLRGGELAVVVRDPQHLVAGGLHRAGLVDIDVSGIRPQRPLVGAQRRVDHRQIGLGAAHQEVNVNVLPAAFCPDFGRGSRAVFVLAIAQGLLHVGGDQPLQHFFMAALAVIIVEIDHVPRSFIFFFCSVHAVVRLAEQLLQVLIRPLGPGTAHGR